MAAQSHVGDGHDGTTGNGVGLADEAAAMRVLSEERARSVRGEIDEVDAVCEMRERMRSAGMEMATTR